MRAINQIRRAADRRRVRQGLVRLGIMHALVPGVPFVLAGSIRTTGRFRRCSPIRSRQDAMRQFTRSDFAVFVATALHAIAVGNCCGLVDAARPEDLAPLTTICVDQNGVRGEQVAGPGNAPGVRRVTNAQTSCTYCVLVERWEQAQAPATVLR